MPCSLSQRYLHHSFHLHTYVGSFQLSHRDSVTGGVSQPSPYPEELSELGIGAFTSLVSRVLVPI